VQKATAFFYDGAQEVEEQDAGSGLTEATYVWSPVYVDELVTYTSAAGTFYTHQDARCDVVAITDTAGNVVERVRFDDFGRAEIRGPGGEVRAASAVGCAYGFQGRRLDAETGLLYFRARMYDPATGRFLQRDPVWDAGNVGGQYTFCGNGPVSGRDPFGLSPQTQLAGELAKHAPEIIEAVVAHAPEVIAVTGGVLATAPEVLAGLTATGVAVGKAAAIAAAPVVITGVVGGLIVSKVAEVIIDSDEGNREVLKYAAQDAKHLAEIAQIRAQRAQEAAAAAAATRAGPNNLVSREVNGGTPGEGGVYQFPIADKTKTGSTGDYGTRYSDDRIQREFPQTRFGPPEGVDDSAYPWTDRRQRRFDEEYIDRTVPRDSRYRAPVKPTRPVDPDKWRLYRDIFGYGDVPEDFGYEDGDGCGD
jgi:RHS repeat-associated protein